MVKKYELTDETVPLKSGGLLHRIRALVDIPSIDVRAGDLGGFIEFEENLSHVGNCWVSENARVFENGIVHGNAVVAGDAFVSGNAQVYGNAFVDGLSWVSNYTRVYDNAIIKGGCNINGNSQIFGSAKLCGDIIVNGNAIICNDVVLSFDEDINVTVPNDAYLMSKHDAIIVSSIGSRDDTTIFFRCRDNLKDDIYVHCGCFRGTIDEFETAVKNTHGSDSKYAKQYNLAIELAKVSILR